MDLDRIFHLKENHTDVKTEVMAGVTSFMTMAYILAVNPNILSAAGMDHGAVFSATAIASFLGTLCMALFANYPFALAPGMGLNAYFAYTVVLGMGYSWQVALAAVLAEGLIFILLSLFNIREAIFNAIPFNLKKAVSVGIGLFIAFIGLQNAGIVVNDASTCVNLHSFNVFTGEQTWATIFPMLITLIAVFAIGAMSKKKVRGAVLWGILGAAVLYYAIGLITVPGFYASAVAPNLTSDFFGAFRDFGTQAFAAVFKSGFDFSAFIAANGTGAFVVMLLTTMLAFCMVDMFDTLGTLYGACSAGNMLDKDGNVPNMDRAMLADACATCAGAVCGTSTVTTFVESSAGVAEGGRTGLTSLTTAAMFILSLFLWPVFGAIPSFATAPALIIVGLFMMSSVLKVKFEGDMADVLGAFVAIIMMPFTYSIANGIMFGILTWMFLKIFRGKVKDIHPVMWVVFALFVLRIVTLCF